MISKAGPKPTRKLLQPPPVRIGTALISTWCAIRKLSSPWSTNAGNVVVSRLVARGDTWTYYGDTTRSTVVFSDDNHVQTVLHERTDDGTSYVPSMRVTLTKID